MKTNTKKVTFLVIAVLLLTSVGAVPSLAQDRRITCESEDNNYRYCRVDTRNNVRLVDKLSNRSCDRGSSWGYDSRGIWVDRGCRAVFAYGGGSNTGRNAAIVGGVAGAAILAGVLAARRNRDRDRDDDDDRYNDGYYNRNDGYYNNNRGIPNWLVGTFRGYTPGNRTYTDMTIYSDGRVWIRATNGTASSQGSYSNGTLYFPFGTYRVDRSGNGFRARNNSDRGDNVLYRRMY